uniref:Uncharacterized protein n=1 Tax=Arion vulgaris TaxID=1028688 RepID=A0A0B6ZEV2_9EUPU
MWWLPHTTWICNGYPTQPGYVVAMKLAHAYIGYIWTLWKPQVPDCVGLSSLAPNSLH